MKDEVKMFNPFDSYIENGKFIIITKGYSELHGKVMCTENIVNPDRVRQIISDLQDNLKRLEK